VAHQEHPSPNNPEGIKGAGEGGLIGALATIAGAVEDALAPLGLSLNELPLREPDLASRCRPLQDLLNLPSSPAASRPADQSPVRVKRRLARTV
jgi:hypothetical protein